MQAAATQWGSAKSLGKVLLAHREPILCRQVAGVEERVERGVGVVGCSEVVGAAHLALIAAENPAVKRHISHVILLDSKARDTTACVNGEVVVDSSVGTGSDAAVALATAYNIQRCVVAVARLVEEQLAKQNLPAKLRRYEE